MFRFSLIRKGDQVPQGKRLDHGILEAALAGLEAQRQRINEQIAAIQMMLGGPDRRRAAPAMPVPAQTVPRKRQMSAAGRKRIAEAQRKRWAQLKREKAQPAKPKRRLSPEGRRRIIEATKKRWAELRKRQAQAAG